MALPVFSIAKLTNATTGTVDVAKTYAFFDLVGAIPTRQERVERVERPGVDDYGLRFLGKAGAEFSLESLGYTLDLDAADAFYATVSDLVGDPLGVAIIQGGSATWPYDVLGIERVEQPGLEKVSSPRIAAGVYAAVRLRWQLVGRDQPAGA